MKKIIAFSGSNSRQSINQMLINFAVSNVDTAEVTVISLRDYVLPVYSQDLEQSDGFPENITKLKILFEAHDALIIASPEHNGSMPAAFKNTIDWLSRLVQPPTPFFGDTKKPVLLLSTSPGSTGGANNLSHLSSLMPWWGGNVKNTYSIGSFYDYLKDGQLGAEKDKELQDIVSQFIQEL